MKHRPLGFQCEKLFTADLFSDLKRDIDTRLESLNPSVVEHDDSGEALERAECDATIAALRDEKALFERHLAAAKEATAAKAALRGEAEAGVLAGEAERRRLHNEVMELNDNVRVFCRVRPPLRSSPVVGLDPTMSMKTLCVRDEWALQRINATVRFCVATRRTAATSSGDETVVWRALGMVTSPWTWRSWSFLVVAERPRMSRIVSLWISMWWTRRAKVQPRVRISSTARKM